MMSGFEDFVRESNKIEGILRDPTVAELEATDDFLSKSTISVGDIDHLAHVFTKGEGHLRSRPGMDVCVGNHVPPPGGVVIPQLLDQLLRDANDGRETPWSLHCRYEALHPFMDGNGRTGRALWAWTMRRRGIRPGLRLGFLHAFYYQTLSERIGGDKLVRELETAKTNLAHAQLEHDVTKQSLQHADEENQRLKTRLAAGAAESLPYPCERRDEQ